MYKDTDNLRSAQIKAARLGALFMGTTNINGHITHAFFTSDTPLTMDQAKAVDPLFMGSSSPVLHEVGQYSPHMESFTKLSRLNGIHQARHDESKKIRVTAPYPLPVSVLEEAKPIPLQTTDKVAIDRKGVGIYDCPIDPKTYERKGWEELENRSEMLAGIMETLILTGTKENTLNLILYRNREGWEWCLSQNDKIDCMLRFESLESSSKAIYTVKGISNGKLELGYVLGTSNMVGNNLDHRTLGTDSEFINYSRLSIG